MPADQESGTGQAWSVPTTSALTRSTDCPDGQNLSFRNANERRTRGHGFSICLLRGTFICLLPLLFVCNYAHLNKEQTIAIICAFVMFPLLEGIRYLYNRVFPSSSCNSEGRRMPSKVQEVRSTVRRRRYLILEGERCGSFAMTDRSRCLQQDRGNRRGSMRSVRRLHRP